MKHAAGRKHVTLKGAVAALIATGAAACAAPGGDPAAGDEDVGSVQVALTAAPSGAACLRVTFSAGTSLDPIRIRQTTDLAAGQRTVLQLGGLPMGAGAVSGEAFALPCSSLTETTVPGWTAAPVAVTVGSLPVTAALAFVRGGQVVVSADFPNVASFEVREVGLGRSHACALLEDQTTRCWGANAFGQIGDGGPTTARLRPVVVSRAPFVEVALGDGFSCGLLADGTVNCWGLAVRNGNAAQQAFPTPLAALSGVSHIAAGDNHACALLVDGAVRCWGENASGQLGNGTINNSANPVSPGLSKIIQLSEGGGSSYALGADGTVWAWGENSGGALGDGTTTSVRSPKRIPGLTNVVQISAGIDFACARIADGKMKCWGQDAVGQVGDGVASLTPRLSPTPVTAFGTTATQIATGQGYVLALLPGGGGVGWGSTIGIGNPSAGTPSLTAVSIAGLFNVTHVAASSGGIRSCAISIGGSLTCWGFNSQGEVGDGTTVTRTSPVPVLF